MDAAHAAVEEVAALLRGPVDAHPGHGLIVGTAADGNSALALVEKTSPDVIVLDVSMPGLSGIDVAWRLRRSGCKAAIVFVSASEESVEAALEAGGSAFISKSLIDADLLVAIEEALAGRTFVSLFPSE